MGAEWGLDMEGIGMSVDLEKNMKKLLFFQKKKSIFFFNGPNRAWTRQNAVAAVSYVSHVLIFKMFSNI